MIYLGSKNRISKTLLSIMLPHCINNWVEPFVGSGGMIDKVPGNVNRVGCDINRYIIALLSAVKNGWIPPSNVSKDLYDHAKKYPFLYSDEMVGFIGFGCSFGGKFFNGYAKNKDARNYAKTSSQSLIKQSSLLKNITLRNCDYTESMNGIEGHALIYCDPPYISTTKYNHDIDHNKFHEWCRDRAREGHTVFVSEYTAHDDFKLVFEKEVLCLLDKNSKSKRTERLYTID